MKNKIILLTIVATILIVSCKKVKRPNEVSPFETTKTEAPSNSGLPADAPIETIVTNPNGKFASMDFTKKVHDFGKIKADSKVETIFEFVNNGKADLVITEAKGSCGCTVPEFPKVPVKIGEKGTIKVSFDSNKKTGDQVKSVTITANTPNGMETLEIKANVLPKN